MTREQFMAMSDQQKWDQYTLLLAECGDSDDAADPSFVKCPVPSGMWVVRNTDTPGEYEYWLTP